MASRQTPPLIPKRGTRQVLPKDRWDELKPLIYQLYIQEGKTFNNIQEIFCETYGFSPTLGQFKKRLTTWGFRKYGTTRRDGNTATVERVQKPDDSLINTCVFEKDLRCDAKSSATESR